MGPCHRPHCPACCPHPAGHATASRGGHPGVLLGSGLLGQLTPSLLQAWGHCGHAGLGWQRCHRLALFPQGLEFPALACHRYFQVPSPACPARGDTRSRRARGHGHGEWGWAGLGGTGPSITEALLCFQVGSAASWDLAVSAPQPGWLGTVGRGVTSPGGTRGAPHPAHPLRLVPAGKPPKTFGGALGALGFRGERRRVPRHPCPASKPPAGARGG